MAEHRQVDSASCSRVWRRSAPVQAVSSGTDGSEFLDYDNNGSAEEIAAIVGEVLRRVRASPARS